MLSREEIVYNCWGKKIQDSTNKQLAALLGATKWFLNSDSSDNQRQSLDRSPFVIMMVRVTAVAQKVWNGRKGDKVGGKLQILAEVQLLWSVKTIFRSPIPWNKRHHYLLWQGSDTSLSPGAGTGGIFLQTRSSVFGILSCWTQRSAFPGGTSHSYIWVSHCDTAQIIVVPP